MTDHHDRGAYTPQSDAPLAFDARSSRGGGGGGGRPMPVTLVISGVILIVLIAALVVYFVHSSNKAETAPPAADTIDAIKLPPPAADAKPAGEAPTIPIYAEGAPPPDLNPIPPQAPAQPGGPNFTKGPEAPAPRPTTATPAPAVKAAPKTADELIAAAEAPKAAPKPAPKPAPAPTTPAKPPVATTAAPQVQIGAFSTPQLAEQSWNSVASKIPGRIAGKTLRVEKAEVDGKTVNRALIGGFASRADADSFCTALKDAGGVCQVRN